MDERGKEEKSAHLKELEEVFKKHTRRFSPFEILGLTPQKPEESSEISEAQSSEPEPLRTNPKSVEPSHGLESHSSVSIKHPNESDSTIPVASRPPSRSDNDNPVGGVIDTPTHGPCTPMPTPLRQTLEFDILAFRKPKLVDDVEDIDDVAPIVPDQPIPGSDGHTQGSEGPIPGMGPSDNKDVVVVKNTTTPKKTTSGTVEVDTPTPGSGKPPKSTERPSQRSSRHTPVPEEHPLHTNTGFRPEKIGHHPEEVISPLQTLQLTDVFAAMQLGTQLGKKARQVLAYLNTVRSPSHESYTVPVGYGQISGAAGIDAHYLRRKVLPKLAMLGLIGIARKGLEGTIYHLPYQVDYVHVVTGELSIETPYVARDEPLDPQESNENMARFPDWIDRERWGWLSPESVRRLVQKAGSEEQAREKLEMIIYNETHGPPERRVRNHRSVLAYYLSSPQAEVWPNDDGFETLEMRRAIWERERARREKTLAEEALQARHEAEQAKFVASLSEAQLQWLKQEAKRRVDAEPASRLLQSRYPLYKAEEEELIQQWIDRAAYGEHIPAADT
jgi:hypothetical protein